jgi:hypothetical protein
MGAPTVGDSFWGALARPRTLGSDHSSTARVSSPNVRTSGFTSVLYVHAREALPGKCGLPENHLQVGGPPQPRSPAPSAAASARGCPNSVPA